MPNKLILLVVFPSYLAYIKNSVGTFTFRNLYFKTENGMTDILNDGDLSCAVFVSSIVRLFNLIGDTHATVESTVRDLERSGWVDIHESRQGCILVWEPRLHDDGAQHRHIGFCVGPNTAVSNNYLSHCPITHEFAYRGGVIERMLWHPALNA